MNKFLIVAAVSALLSACGGGGGSDGSPAANANTPANTSASPAPAGTTTAPVPAAAPAPTGQIATAPAIPSSVFQVTTRSFTQGENALQSAVKFSGATTLTLSGDLNKIWVNAAQAGGGAEISGKMNTVVFMPGVDTTVTVTGSGNTIYVPVGSPIKLEGAGLASSTILRFNP